MQAIDPIYPLESIGNLEEGTTEFVIIGHEDGKINVVTTRWVPGRLKAAAETALQQWRWKQYRLNGQVIGFQTSVYFKFDLSPDGPRVQTLLSKPRP
jgi:hypothetical protein